MILINNSLRSEDIESKVMGIYNELHYVNIYSDSASLMQFKNSLINIGQPAIPFLYKAVFNDKDSLKLFAVANVLTDIYEKPPFDDIVSYNQKYFSKNMDWLCISLFIRSFMKFMMGYGSIDIEKARSESKNITISKENMDILIRGLKYDKFIIQYLFPIHEAETISSICLGQVYGLCFTSMDEFTNYEERNQQIEYITEWWKKNREKAVWDNEMHNFIIK